MSKGIRFAFVSAVTQANGDYVDVRLFINNLMDGLATTLVIVYREGPGEP